MILFGLAFIIGAALGSFIGLVYYRYTLSQSIIIPASYCENCHRKLTYKELIPIISKLITPKCKTCGFIIPKLYCWLEISLGIICSLLYLVLGANLFTIYLAILVSFLIFLSMIDFRYQTVKISHLLVLTLIALIPIEKTLQEKLLFFLLFIGSFFTLDLLTTYYVNTIKPLWTKKQEFYERALGEADILVAGVIGAMLGLEDGIFAIIIASVYALLYFVIKKSQKTIPFIPFLSAGLITTILIKGVS